MTKDVVKASFWGVVAGMAVVLLLSINQGCVPAKPGEDPTRASARATILLVAKAVQSSDKLCASYALQTKEISVAKACADIYDAARPSLLTAEAALDSWDAAAQGSVGCAISAGVKALVQITVVLNNEKLAVPSVVTDALQLAAGINFGCVVSKDGGVD